MTTSQSPIYDAGDALATDYGAVERLIAEANRRHDVVSSVAKWLEDFRFFNRVLGRIGLDDENEDEKKAFLSVVRKIMAEGHRILETVEAHGIDTEKECGIRLAALRACVEEMEGYERMLFLDPAVEEKLNHYFGVK